MLNTSSTAQNFCSKFLMNTVKRDVSAVEACFEISRLPLYRCSHQFQLVSLSGLKLFESDGNFVTKNNSFNTYLSRHPGGICSFYDFICRSGRVPVFSSILQASWPLTEDYCRHQLLIHWPNRRNVSDISLSPWP